jgi:hypothetical protein
VLAYAKAHLHFLSRRRPSKPFNFCVANIS